MSQPTGLHDPRRPKDFREYQARMIAAAKSDPWSQLGKIGGSVPSRFVDGKASVTDLGAKCEKMPDKPTSMFLCGPVGVGKSHLAAGLLAKWLPLLFGDDGTPSYHWVYWPKVALAIISREPANIKHAPKLLIIDDIAWQVKRQEPLLVLESLVNERWERRLPTVVTSNMKLEEWDLINPRIASRLSDGYVVQFSGDDRRTRAGRVIVIEEEVK